jgi:His/Glu/Gln/Arg/opine family amino acid ABC transporter permease subunit
MNAILYAMPYLTDGLLTTIFYSVSGLFLAMILGWIIALLYRSNSYIVKKIIGYYVRFFRNTPFMVQVYLAYYIPPSMGIHPKAQVIGIVILTLYEAAYLAVTYSVGFDALPPGQEEAARVLNLPYHTIVFRILAPQIFRIIIPALTNQMILTIKDSSILSVITISELTLNATQCASLTYSPFSIFLVAGLMYWALNLVIEIGTKIYEHKQVLMSK